MAPWQPPNAPPPAPRPGVSPTGPASAEWETVGTDFTQRHAFVAIIGPESSGKTTLALTLPGPLAFLHHAEKIKGVIEPFVVQGKLIRKHDFHFMPTKGDPEEAVAQKARVVWAKAAAAYNDAWDWAKGIIVDTETDMWKDRRYARFGTLTPKGDLRDLYNVVNTDWRQMFKLRYRGQATDHGVNLVTIHQCSDEYKDVVIQAGPKKGQKNSERTGQQKREGNKEVGYWADVVLWCSKDSLIDFDYHVRIAKGWFNGSVEGMDLTDKIMVDLGYSGLNLPAILAFITQTPEGEWL